MSEVQQESNEVSESRFNMWRAVFAIAHADGFLDLEEQAFAAKYLETLPFSDEQTRTLRHDLAEPQDPAEMFEQITNPEDQSDFFQFARLMAWSDGDLEEQEREIKDKIRETHMASFNQTRFESELARSREDARLRREQEDASLKEWAKGHASLSAVLSFLNPLD